MTESFLLGFLASNVIWITVWFIRSICANGDEDDGGFDDLFEIEQVDFGYSPPRIIRRSVLSESTPEDKLLDDLYERTKNHDV